MIISLIEPIRFTVYDVYPGLTLGLLFLATIGMLLGIVFLIKRSSTRTLTMLASLMIALALLLGAICLIVMQQYSPWPLPIFSGVLAIIGVLLFIKRRR
jgi:amino acid transporter